MAAAREKVVIVDADPSCGRLAAQLRDAGRECVRVQSTGDAPGIAPDFEAAGYVAEIRHRGSLRDTLREVAAHRPVAVVCGSGIGVELADALSEKLGLATNGTALSAARRDRYLMIEAIRAAGLRAARQVRVGSEAELEYLAGTEHIVNTVSGAGLHHVCDIWQTTRVDVNGVLDAPAGRFLVPREGAAPDRLVQYAGRVLDALGIRFGPAQIRVRATPDGPCLIGFGAHLGGDDQPYHAELATGESQLNWTVDAYLNPQRFAARHPEPYRIHQHVASVRMLSPREGILRSYPLLDRVERLESRFEVRIAVHSGQSLARTVDAATCPMTVNLRHPSEGVVMRDMVTLRHYDGPSFYDVV